MKPTSTKILNLPYSAALCAGFVWCMSLRAVEQPLPWPLLLVNRRFFSADPLLIKLAIIKNVMNNRQLKR
mgnify:CR=1 FL=1